MIVAAQKDDWPAILALLQEASLPVDDLDASRCDSFLVARSGDSAAGIAGAIGLEQFGEIGLLRSLVVHNRHRGAGIGRALVAALESRAALSGIAQLFLLTIDADKFFLGCGYRPVERPGVPARIRETREFTELCPGDAAVMRKDLRAIP